MSNTAQPKIEDLETYAQKKQFIEALSFFPALLILIFIRRKMGFRMLKLLWLTSMAWILALLPVMFHDSIGPRAFLLPLVGVAMVVVGFVERYRRWSEICTGTRWHTFSAGISYFEKLPLPSFFRRCRRIYRFLDPLLCLGLSIVGGLVSRALGSVLFICAISVFIYEGAVFEGILKRDLDTLDSLVEAEIQGETVKFYEGKQQGEALRTLEQTAGIATGISEDISRQVAVRKAAQKT